MIDYTKPIHRKLDGMIICTYYGNPYSMTEKSNPAAWAEVEAYLAEHPEALVPEPAPPPPTKEQIAEQERQANLAYLASTDWYAIRYAETGKAVPDDILKARQAARDVLSLNKGEPNVSAST